MSDNGVKRVHHMHYEWVARLIAEGGPMCRLRMTAIGRFPEGHREVASCEIQIFEGGVEMLREVAPGIHQLANMLATEKIGGILTRP